MAKGRTKTLYAYVADPECRMCGGVGTTPDSYMGSHDSRPCSCQVKIKCVKDTTYQNTKRMLEDVEAERDALAEELRGIYVSETTASQNEAVQWVQEITKNARAAKQAERANKSVRNTFLFGKKS